VGPKQIDFLRDPASGNGIIGLGRLVSADELTKIIASSGYNTLFQLGKNPTNYRTCASIVRRQLSD
jgi:hypothetical protein